MGNNAVAAAAALNDDLRRRSPNGKTVTRLRKDRAGLSLKRACTHMTSALGKGRNSPEKVAN